MAYGKKKMDKNKNTVNPLPCPICGTEAHVTAYANNLSYRCFNTRCFMWDVSVPLEDWNTRSYDHILRKVAEALTTRSGHERWFKNIVVSTDCWLEWLKEATRGGNE